MKYKIYIIFAMESIAKMNGIRGKMCSQAGHAALHSFWDAMPGPDKPYINVQKHRQAIEYQQSLHAYKITLRVDTVDELKALQEKYKDICGTSLVTDAGYTVFDGPTTTCLGLGPISEDNIGDDLRALKTFT